MTSMNADANFGMSETLQTLRFLKRGVGEVGVYKIMINGMNEFITLLSVVVNSDVAVYSCG